MLSVKLKAGIVYTWPWYKEHEAKSNIIARDARKVSGWSIKHYYQEDLIKSQRRNFLTKLK